MPKISRIVHREQGRSWNLLECSTGRVLSLVSKDGSQYPLGNGVPWTFAYRGEELMLLRQVAEYAPLVVNGREYGDEDRYSVIDADFSVLIKDRSGRVIPWLLFQSRPELVIPPRYLLKRPGAGQPEGPYWTWSALESSLKGPEVAPEAVVIIEGSLANFQVKHLRGKFGHENATPSGPPTPRMAMPAGQRVPVPRQAPAQPHAPPAKTDQGHPVWGKVFVPTTKLDKGELLCLYCRERFEDGDYYFFPAHQNLIGEPPAAPSNWDLRGRPLDSMGCVCEERACPHCGGRLPDSFGPGTKYTIISLVGQTHTGKSYYIGTMGRRLRPALSRHHVDLMDDDAELNKPFLKLCNIPFTPGAPWKRYIDKTDESQATQATVWYESEQYSVPKPFILRIMDGNTGGLVRLVLYDNAGEDFTQVEQDNPTLAKKGKIASGHLAHASFVMVLYDPSLDREFCAKLGLEPSLDDLQLTMLQTMDARIKVARADGPSDVPLAILVGKSDLWEKTLAPRLRKDVYTPEGHLNLAAVHENSAMLIQLLDDLYTGIPGAARLISRNVCFFPMTALGQKPEKCYHPELFTEVEVPTRVAEPWGVEIPVLWGLWKVGLLGDDED